MEYSVCWIAKVTLSSAIEWAIPQLQESCDRQRFEAELLLAYHIGKDRIYIYTHPTEELEHVENFKSLIYRRAKHEPYEYIVGSVSFYDIELSISEGVLIPRPETELLIDRVATIIERENIKHLIEIGVGSAAISIVLARKFPTLQIVATDISSQALQLARKNIEKFGLTDRIKLIQTNLMDGVATQADRQADIVVSNPPYIADGFKLDKNVSEYEPHTALFGGVIGDELLLQIVRDTKARSIEWLACEMGYDQRASMYALFESLGVKEYEFYQDLAGLDRGFVVKM